MAEPGSAYVQRWRDEIAGALDGSWCAHSCFLADDLAARTRSSCGWSPSAPFTTSVPRLTDSAGCSSIAIDDLTGVASVHLAAHLWWDEDRRDFSDVHARAITEEWVRTSPSTYATIVRPHLAAHDVFA